MIKLIKGKVGAVVVKKVIYYQDELNDDFANIDIKTKKLDDGYKYLHQNLFWRFIEFVLYRLIAQPLVFLFSKIVYHQKFINKKVLKAARKSGAFLYANHSHTLMDAFSPNLICVEKRSHIIAGPDTTSIPGIKNLVVMLGVIPIGYTVKHMRNLIDCIEYRIKQKRIITIFPEAHIWPYYTKIRPFVATSFKYPVEFNQPVFTMTNCYQKKRFGKRPKIISIVDGPFYPDKSLSKKEQTQQLRDICYETMKARAEKYSTYEYIKYVKQEKK